jgi:hypothetical protein
MQVSSNLLACEQPSSRPPPPPLETPPNVPQKEFKKNPPGVTVTASGKRKRDTLPKYGDRVKVYIRA